MHGVGASLRRSRYVVMAAMSSSTEVTARRWSCRPLRRIHIEAHHIAQLGHDRGIRRHLEVRDLVWLQTIRAPQPRDGRLIPARRVGHQPRTPMRAAVRRGLSQRLRDDPRFLRRVELPRASRPRPVGQESFAPLGLIPIQPETHRRTRDGDCRADGAARESLGRCQYDAGALHDARGRRAGAHPFLQGRAISALQLDDTNGQWHGLQSTRVTRVMHAICASYH
jgi:hypothetical protein